MKTRIGGYNSTTSAIKPTQESQHGCRIIRPEFSQVHRPEPIQQPANPIARLARRVFESSEMLCSLFLEDFRGCAYNLFSEREAIVTGVILCTLATLAIVFGA